METNRRTFLKFLGSSASLPALGASGSTLPKPVPPSMADELKVSTSFQSYLVAKWGETINPQGDRFGINNDFIAFVPLKAEGSEDRALLWVNHEYPTPELIHGNDYRLPRKKEDVLQEMDAVGGSIIEIRRDRTADRWHLVPDSPLGRRLDANTPIPFSQGISVAGSKVAVGTLAGCSGGKTPWGSVLSCEENYQDFYKEKPSDERSKYGWETVFPRPPEHYGWVVEIDPMTGDAKKLVSLGRFSHEGAFVTTSRKGYPVVYMGDDGKGRCLYKFVSHRKDSLEEGDLYAADVAKGTWLKLSWEEQPVLKKRFADQLDVMVHCREAAEMIGASPLNRPEGIAVNPRNGDVIVALTNNEKQKDFHGSLLRVKEQDGDPGSTSFAADTFFTGGKKGELSCPDNIAFDSKGNLWVTTDMSGKIIGGKEHANFGQNGLFFIPLEGANAGIPIQVASAPANAEFTGPAFTPDGRTLLLSVQHPGEYSKSLGDLISHWPDGGDKLPRSAVIAIKGVDLPQNIARL